jgi:hypothetical protein
MSVLCPTLSQTLSKRFFDSCVAQKCSQRGIYVLEVRKGAYHIGLRYFNKTNGGLIVRDCATEIHGFFKCSRLPLSHSLIVLPHPRQYVDVSITSKSKRGIVVNAPLAFSY